MCNFHSIMAYRRRSDSTVIDLSGRLLSSVYFKQYFCLIQDLDLSSNQLKSIDNVLPYLVECKTLNVDNNLIEDITHFCETPMEINGGEGHSKCGGRKLKTLSVKGNPISLNEIVLRRITKNEFSHIFVFS